MPPARSPARSLRALPLILLSTIALPGGAHALRLVDYNVLNYPGSTAATRDPKFRTVLEPIAPDVFVGEEVTSQVGTTGFLNNVLNVLEPGQWAAAPFIDGNDTDCALFYKPSKVSFEGQWAFYPNSANLLRFVHVYRIKPVGYVSGATEIRLYTLHLKASMGFEAQRLAECAGLRDSMNAMPPGTFGFALGDFNFYKASTEPGYGKLMEVQSNNIGRLYDPLFSADWHDDPLSAPIHTQSPCLSGGCASGASTGGMDDRFDFFLPTLNLNDGESVDLVPGSYAVIGNDGLHFNRAITDTPTIAQGAAYASALIGVSDHLPLRIDLQVPARISAPASLALGTVIVGGGATLDVSNPATPPADELDLSFAPPAGFTAPGPGVVNVGASVGFAIGTAPGPPGPRSGTLTLTTDAPDFPTRLVDLSADVLDHAEASLDSLVVLLADTLDFGTHEAGAFGTLPARVYNRLYDSSQARLSLASASITGPAAGRFSIVGGFSPSLVADTPARHTIAFDDAGAPLDSTYQATLTFGSADEPLPGAAPQPNLVLTLLARVGTGSVGTPPATPPTATRLYAPYPNPLAGSSIVRFDLARRSELALEVFDLTGRRVATLARGSFAPGQYSFPWNGRNEDGRAATTGLYFVRLNGSDIGARMTRLALLH